MPSENKPSKSASELTEADFANDKMGDNKLQGDDQSNVHNQRHAVPRQKNKADDNIMETLEMEDKHVRAERELGKGNRSGNKS